MIYKLFRTTLCLAALCLLLAPAMKADEITYEEPDTLWVLETGSIHKAIFTPDGESIIYQTFHNMGKIYEVSVETGKIIDEYNFVADFNGGLDLTPSGDTIITGMSNGNETVKIYFYDRLTKEIVDTLSDFYPGFIEVSPDMSKIYISGKDTLNGDTVYTIKVYSYPDKEKIALIDVDGKDIWNMKISPDGRFIAASTTFPVPNEQYYNATVYLCDAQSFELIQKLETEPGSVRDLKFSPDGRYLGIVHDMTTGNSYTPVSLWTSRLCN
jgi:WD40 repeat protein